MMNEVGDAGRRLKDACLSGSVAALEALINEDELILDRVSSLTGFINDSTPLHVAALRGHLDFAKALLTRKPDLATELDSSRSSPLHLACTKGHFEIVEELLRVNTDVCIGRDEDGRIPLHLAAIKGRVDVIPALLQVVPESIHEKLDSGETVLHLCVKYNMLEALKTLVKYVQKNNKESLLSSGDNDGNNILHLAAALKQMTTIKYLLEIKIVKDDANVKNRKGFTALDFVEHCPNRDLKTMEILEFLFQAGLRRPACGGSNSMPESPGNPPQRRSKAGVLQRIYLFWIKYFKINPTWLREVRGHLITTAILTATFAYQAMLTPPDGFLKDSGTNGNPLDDYVLVNTLVIIGSFCTIMLALSGFPAENKFLMWLLIFTVYVTIICMSRGYFLLFSFQAAERTPVRRRSAILWYVWIVLCGFVFVLHAFHFFVWLWNKFENLKWLRNMFGDLVKTRSRSSESGVVINIPR